MATDDVEIHPAKYRRVLVRSDDGVGPPLPAHVAFEYAWALEERMLLSTTCRRTS